MDAHKLTAQGRLTSIDDTNIHGETLAREVGHISHIITGVGYSKEPVEDGSPDADPDQEGLVEGSIVELDDNVDGVVEERDQAGDTDDGQGLGAKDAEDYGSKGRREESLVDAELLVGTTVHVEDKGQGRQQTTRPSARSSKEKEGDEHT